MADCVTKRPPPVSTILTISHPTCSLSGEPPFIVKTEYECIASKPIWALVRLFTDFGGGIRIRDPQRNNRQIGGKSSLIADDWDEEALDLGDTELVRLEPGQMFSTSYTVSVVPKAGGLRDSDTKNMVQGNTYYVTLRRRRWRWMFEDEMPENLTEKERRDILKKEEAMEWDVDCSVHFEAA